MRLTDRDLRLIRDVCLSHVLSRDQIIRLGYFRTICRANARLGMLRRYVKPIATPFHRQFLYVPGTRAAEVAGPRIAHLLKGRSNTPRFLQHALAVTNIRARLGGDWRFELQLRHALPNGLEIKPDGAVLSKTEVEFVEADLGHVSSARWARRLRSYAAYFASPGFDSLYEGRAGSLLVVTTGPLRLSHLKGLLPGFGTFITFKDLGAEIVGGWS